MPEFTSRHAAAALEDVVAYIGSLGTAARPLTAPEIARLGSYSFVRGWRLTVILANRIRALDALLDAQFPRTAPRIALVEPPPPLTWPHVEASGLLCLLPESASVDAGRPTDVLRDLLDSTCKLVEACAAGRREEDFREEFHSYWSHRTARSDAVISLLSIRPPTRLISMWEGVNLKLLADTDAALQRWLFNRFGQWIDRSIVRALLLWLERPLLPREYPRTATDIRDLASNCGGTAQTDVERLLLSQPSTISVILAARTASGGVLGYISVPSVPASRLQAGFRPGRVPAKVLVARQLGDRSIGLNNVTRADSAWVHCRSGDKSLETLQRSKVAVLGCGSLGAPVAMILAQAGVGNLLLVDPEKLNIANTGRHVLGADDVGKNKADALATRLRTSYPTLTTIDSQATRSETLAPTGILDSCDLVIAATGNWASDAALNEHHVVTGRVRPILYAWMEERAAAGHAVIVTRKDGCLQCGFAPDGLPLRRATLWADTQSLSEPGCGALYQPYGPAASMRVAALVADLALESLRLPPTSSTHRACTVTARRLAAVGGAWDPHWIEAGASERGGEEIQFDWPSRDKCSECAGAT